MPGLSALLGRIVSADHAKPMQSHVIDMLHQHQVARLIVGVIVVDMVHIKAFGEHGEQPFLTALRMCREPRGMVGL
jgi:hypothetical protein